MNRIAGLISGRARLAAFITALAMAGLFILEQVASAVTLGDTTTGIVLTALFDAILWIWVLAYAALILDLPPAGRVTGTRWSVARWAALIAAIAPAVLIVFELIGSLGLVLLAYPIVLAALGLSLLALNLTTRAEGIVYGGLASIGIVTGIAFLAAGIGYGIGAYVVSPLLQIGESALLGGQILFVVWASWLARRLHDAGSIDTGIADEPSPEPPADAGDG